jgi:hypothetical protein
VAQTLHEGPEYFSMLFQQSEQKGAKETVSAGLPHDGQASG